MLASVNSLTPSGSLENICLLKFEARLDLYSHGHGLVLVSRRQMKKQINIIIKRLKQKQNQQLLSDITALQSDCNF